MSALPRAGFFVPDGTHRTHSPRLPHDGSPYEDKGTPTGMQIRSILNDDTPDEETPAPGERDDWFGGANGGDNGSVTTEDESDAPKRQSSRPEHSQDPYRSSRHGDPYARQYSHDPHYADAARFEYEEAARYQMYANYPPPPNAQHRYESIQQGRSSNPWVNQPQPHQQQQPSYAPYPPYGPPMPLPQVMPRHATHYSSQPSRLDYFSTPHPGPQQQKYGQQPSGYRQVPPPNYPPPSTYGHQPTPPPPPPQPPQQQNHRR